MKNPNLKKLNSIPLTREFKAEEFLKTKMVIDKDGRYYPTKITNTMASQIAGSCNAIMDVLNDRPRKK